MGIGLGAENVVGYSTLTEFVPARSAADGWADGRLRGDRAAGGFVAGLSGVPVFGWRVMFVLGGVGAIVVWYLRKNLPESPRWLEAVGRRDEAEALMQEIEREAAQGRPLPPPVVGAAAPASTTLASIFAPPLLSRMFVGSVCLVMINTLIYGFITWLPVFFVKQGLSIAKSFGYSLLMAIGAPIGAAIGALTADSWGRKPTIVGASLVALVLGVIYPLVSDPLLLPALGFTLTVPIYVLVALLFGIYMPELFPTEVRLRASGICNTFGRGATVVTPFLVVALFRRTAWRRDEFDDRAAGDADRRGLDPGHRAAQPQPRSSPARPGRRCCPQENLLRPICWRGC